MTKKRKKPRRKRDMDLIFEFTNPEESKPLFPVYILDIRLLLDKKARENHKSFRIKYWSRKPAVVSEPVIDNDGPWYINTEDVVSTHFRFGLDEKITNFKDTDWQDMVMEEPKKDEIIIFEVGAEVTTHRLRRAIDDNYDL